ncbi:TonB-dependent receptor plug domain-containing protein [Pseudoduganella chitinolytica]|uniref:TonB-dependent receptor n=1 Tax=Pseudoduganella chitinolytica TaxID=34070 RepID=A0ABY8BLF2_9BURK|nr:TonB-dependent receptor [Pseudoduganella chitinolytica]WEF35109.1 TonB-dependent receptor [Pseudoduganella chitinolytica]
MKRTPVALAVLCLSALPCAGAATPDDLTALPLEQLLQVPMVTSASRFEQSVSDAPSAVVVLTARDIREHGWRTLADALASVPGLYVTQDRNYTYLGARGFLRPGDYDSRFLLLIDGVRLNDAVYDQALVGNEGLLDMDLVARIEYVPGPGAAVYGSNALFGVINVITKTGSALAGPQASVTLAGAGERRVRASYGWHAQNGDDLLLSASGYRRRGDDLYFPEFDTLDQNGGIARGLDGERAHSVFAKAAGRGFVFSAGYVAREKDIPTGSFGAVFNRPNTTRDTQAFADLGYTHQAAPGVLLAANAFWGQADYEGAGWYPDGEGGARRNVDGAHAAWYGANVHATVTAVAGHKLVAGIEGRRNARRDQYNYNEGPYEPLLDERHADSRWGVYLDDEIALRPWLLLNAGVRYDRDSVIGSRVSPRAALIARPGARDTVKLIAGSAYRSPNAYELYYAIPGADGMLANPALRAEAIRTRELVWERMQGAYGKLTASLFRYRMDDLITQQVDSDTGMLVFRNTDRAVAHGLELAGERTFQSGTRVRASYTWQLARDGAGAWLVSSPRHLAKLAAAVPLPGLPARLGNELHCSSARRTEHALAGGYCVANLTLTALPGAFGRGVGVAVSVYNLFDRRYGDPAGPAFVQEALARPGRTLALRLDYDFGR